MDVKKLGTEPNGTRSVEIRTNEIGFSALVRHIRRIPGAVVSDVARDPMNDNAKCNITYKDLSLTVETPFSDYVINCRSGGGTFDEFIDRLACQRVKWWERFF